MTGTARQLPMAPTGQRPRGPSPFGAAAPSIAVAVAFAVATLVWVAVGDRLPGGRWLAVHLFTLGVLTNLVLTFSEHFSRALTRTPGERAAWWPLVTNAGILAVVVGRVAGQRIVLALGASAVTAAVFLAYRRLRRMRRTAVGARFGWVVRAYERAHGAFIHGAVLGSLLGVGVIPGRWYGGVRLAHLHANVLGWGGLTLLATLVFFGPTMARTRIEPGSDARSARVLRHGATGLSVAVLSLLVIGVGGWPGTAARLVAAAGLAVLALATTLVCVPVARAVVAGKRTASRPLVVGVCSWLPVVLWADVTVVGLAAWRWLDALALAALVGALAQAILATLLSLAPMLFGRTTEARDRILRRVEVASTGRAWAVNVAVVAIALGAVEFDLPDVVASAGWVVLGIVVVVSLAVAAWPTAPDGPCRRREAPELVGDGASRTCGGHPPDTSS